MVQLTQQLIFCTIRIKSHGEDPSQDQGGCTSNTHCSHNILFRCCRRRAVFLHTNRWSRWNQRTDPTKKTISWKSSRMGSQPGTILIEAKYQRIHKDRRKHYCVLPSWNQGKCQNTSRARCRSSVEEPHDDVLLTTDSRFKHYKANEDRIIVKDGLLFRRYYGETGSVKYYQILIPKQLVNEVLGSLHGEFGKHPRITKTISAYRQK